MDESSAGVVPTGLAPAGYTDPASGDYQGSFGRTYRRVSLTTCSLEWLNKARRTIQPELTIRNLISRVECGEYFLFDLDPGIAILRILQWEHERELQIYGMAGKEVLARLKEICAALRGVAKLHGCSWIGGMVARPALYRAYRAAGAKEVGIVMRMDVE